MKRIRVAIVDDSSFVRKALSRMLGTIPELIVVGAASSGEELLAHLAQWEPDLVTLDLGMPGMGGLATLDRILAWRPIPVIVLSGTSSREALLAVEALQRGTVDFIDKQRFSLVDFEALRPALTERIFALAGPSAPPSVVEAAEPIRPPSAPRAASSEFDAVVMGASTGGPLALQLVLEALPPVLSAPVFIAQHMPEGFTEPFATRLDGRLPFRVRESEHASWAEPGAVYVARAGVHLRLRREGARTMLLHSSTPADLPHKPSVDELFESARQCFGARCIAVLLTGMGRDGARGLASLAAAGAHTIGQDERSCVVYGMPGAARALGAVREELPLDEIGPRIAALLGRARNGAGA